MPDPTLQASHGRTILGIRVGAFTLWTAQQAARAALARGDAPTAINCIDTIGMIERNAGAPALRRAARSALGSLADLADRPERHRDPFDPPPIVA